MPSTHSSSGFSSSAPASDADKNYHQPHSVQELTQQNVETIIDLEEAAKARRTTADLVADVISDFCGSMTFVWVHIAWFMIWIGLNTLTPAKMHFDKFPFTFLTLVVSLEAIFLSTFILISQNHQMRLSERRNHLDLQVNLLSEQENTKMLQLLQRIAHQVGVPLEDDPDVKILEEATRPEHLLQQIEQTAKIANERDSDKGKSENEPSPDASH